MPPGLFAPSGSLRWSPWIVLGASENGSISFQYSIRRTGQRGSPPDASRQMLTSLAPKQGPFWQHPIQQANQVAAQRIMKPAIQKGRLNSPKALKIKHYKALQQNKNTTKQQQENYINNTKYTNESKKTQLHKTEICRFPKTKSQTTIYRK